MAGAAFRDVLVDSWSANCHVAFFDTKCISKVGRERSPKRRVQDDDFMVGSCSDYPRVMVKSSLCWRSTSGISRSNLELKVFLAGAVLGEVEG